jgi:AcrR family transcriptional regulator
MRTEGFAATTTKSIAREAGLSEGTLYKHFTDKSELFLAVLHERLPAFGPFAAALTAGGRSLREWLTAVARAALVFYTDMFPMTASVFADPELLAAHRLAIARLGAGPSYPMTALATSLRARTDVRADADCDAASVLLLGACFQFGFLRGFEQRTAPTAEVDQYATAITTMLITGLALHLPALADQVVKGHRCITGAHLGAAVIHRCPTCQSAFPQVRAGMSETRASVRTSFVHPTRSGTCHRRPSSGGGLSCATPSLSREPARPPRRH